MTFVAGKSGNPNGRPKNLNTAAIHARRHVEKAIQVLVNGLVDKDAKVRVSAANSLLDRGWGKPKEHVELTGEDGGPITTTAIPATDEWIARVLARGEKAASKVSGKN